MILLFALDWRTRSRSNEAARYDAVTPIRRPRAFARALGAMVAEQFGPRAPSPIRLGEFVSLMAALTALVALGRPLRSSARCSGSM